MISAVVTGKAGRDPELRTTGAGNTMAKFSVASSQKKGEEYQTTWVDVLCFGEQAEQVAERVQKGTRVTATGKMQLEQYEKRDGTPGSSLVLMADDVGISLRFAPAGATAAASTSSDEYPTGW